MSLDRDLKADQDALTTFQRSNDLAILQEESSVAGSCLAKLKTWLSELKLQAQLLEASALEQQIDPVSKTNSGGFLVEAIPSSDSALSSSPAGAERQDLDTYRQAVKMRTRSLEASIKEWKAKGVQANAGIAEAERLKLRINRTQNLCDLLALLLQNADISRNVDQETAAVVEPAAPAQRSYKKELSVLGLALFAGLVLGLGIVFLVEVRDDRLSSVAEVNVKLTDNILGQVPELPRPLGNKAGFRCWSSMTTGIPLPSPIAISAPHSSSYR